VPSFAITSSASAHREQLLRGRVAAAELAALGPAQLRQRSGSPGARADAGEPSRLRRVDPDQPELLRRAAQHLDLARMADRVDHVVAVALQPGQQAPGQCAGALGAAQRVAHLDHALAALALPASRQLLADHVREREGGEAPRDQEVHRLTLARSVEAAMPMIMTPHFNAWARHSSSGARPGTIRRGGARMQASDSTIRLERDAFGVATLTLNRPEALNAWNGRMAGEVDQALRECEADDGVRAVVVTGAGRAFCAGRTCPPGRSFGAAAPARGETRQTSRLPGPLLAFQMTKPVVAPSTARDRRGHHASR
jgi:hypothetical protein